MKRISLFLTLFVLPAAAVLAANPQASSQVPKKDLGTLKQAENQNSGAY